MVRPISARLSIVLMMFVLVVLPALAGGKLIVENKAWNAGEVELGSVIEHNFLFTNGGDAPVKIKDVLPQCGCTVPKYPSTIAPGETASVRLRIDTKTLHSGKNSKTTTVLTDAPGAERVILQVRMQLFTPLEFLPKSMVYLRTQAGREKVERVLARPHRPGMKIVGVTSSSPNIRASLEPVEALRGEGDDEEGGLAAALLPRKGDSWIKVSLSSSAPVGIHRAELVVSTTDPDYPEAIVKVSAVVKEREANKKQ